MLRFPKTIISPAIVVLTCGFVFSAAGVAAEGSICIAPVRDDAGTLDTGAGNRRGYVSYEFNVRIDQGDWVNIPADKPLRIKAIDLGKKHLISIRDGNRIVESFWFTFEARRGTNLCLFYRPWYQTWVLELPGNRPWCQCKD